MIEYAGPELYSYTVRLEKQHLTPISISPVKAELYPPHGAQLKSTCALKPFDCGSWGCLEFKQHTDSQISVTATEVNNI